MYLNLWPTLKLNRNVWLPQTPELKLSLVVGTESKATREGTGWTGRPQREMKNCWPNGLSPAEAALYQKVMSPKTDTVLL